MYFIGTALLCLIAVSIVSARCATAEVEKIEPAVVTAALIVTADRSSDRRVIEAGSALPEVVCRSSTKNLHSRLGLTHRFPVAETFDARFDGILWFRRPWALSSDRRNRQGADLMAGDCGKRA
jgi:hypothetical protein